MASIARKDGRWTVRWRGLDGREHRRGCPDKRTADRLKVEIERSIALGADWAPSAPAQDAPVLTLSTLAQAYLDSVSRTVTSKSVVRYGSIIDLWVRWSAAQGRTSLAHLSRDQISAWHGWLLSERGISRISAADYTRIVGRMWAWGYDSDTYGELVGRPRQVDVGHVPAVAKTPAPSWAQMDIAIAASTRWVRQLAIIMRCTGLRAGQVVRLLWTDLDLEAGLLTVRPELGKSAREQAGRVVPISQHLVAELATWGVRDGLLVPGAAHGASLSEAGNKVWGRTGVSEQVWGHPWHCFRKGFVTGLASAGAQEQMIKVLVGHAGGVTSDVYTDHAQLMDRLRATVALVPPICTTAVPIRAPRVRRVSG